MASWIIAFAVFFGLFTGVASAACEYCGDRLICEGDGIAKLLELCGQPLSTQKVEVKKSKKTPKKSRRETIQTVEEKWLYQNPYGALNAIRTYTIKSGKIVKIE